MNYAMIRGKVSSLLAHWLSVPGDQGSNTGGEGKKIAYCIANESRSSFKCL